jgi:transposase
MAKAKKNSHLVDGIEPDSAPDTASAVATEVEKPRLTTEQMRELFDDWKAADGELDAVKAKIDAAAEKRSECVRAIVEALGNKGPWTVDGVRLSATERGGRFNMQRESDAKFTL